MIRPPSVSENSIREHAYRLWLEEGQLHGRAAEHWGEGANCWRSKPILRRARMVSAKVRISLAPGAEPVEVASTLENQGEVSTTTDQCE